MTDESKTTPPAPDQAKEPTVATDTAATVGPGAGDTAAKQATPPETKERDQSSIQDKSRT